MCKAADEDSAWRELLGRWQLAGDRCVLPDGRDPNSGV
jgi:hypothetical protein